MPSFIFKFLCMKGTEAGLGNPKLLAKQNRKETGPNMRHEKKFIFKKVINVFAYPT